MISNVYRPNGDQPTFYIQLYNLLLDFSTDNILIGGDLNVVLNPNLDKAGGDKILSHVAEALHSLMDKFDYTHIHRHFHPYTKSFTWRHWKLETCTNFHKIGLFSYLIKSYKTGHKI